MIWIAAIFIGSLAGVTFLALTAPDVWQDADGYHSGSQYSDSGIDTAMIETLP